MSVHRPPDDALEAAFAGTHYRVLLAGAGHILRIGEPLPEPLRQWLAQERLQSSAWLITADNPGAVPIDAARNRARRLLLERWAARHARAWLECINEDPAGQWPDEPGLLVAGVAEAAVRRAGQRFGQAAVVDLCADRAPRLVWLR